MALAPPHRPEYLEAVTTGEHQIEDDEVESFGVNAEEGVLARRGHVDTVVLRFEPLPQGLRHLRFVFHDQDAHEIGVDVTSDRRQLPAERRWAQGTSLSAWLNSS